MTVLLTAELEIQERLPDDQIATRYVDDEVQERDVDLEVIN